MVISVAPILRERHIRIVITRFGGVPQIARILGTSRDAVYKWRTHIPADSALALLAYAKKQQMSDVTLELLRPDYFPTQDKSA